MNITETFIAVDRAKWRNWLIENHKQKQEIWLLSPKKATGLVGVAYNDAVEEALCFGWIDGIAKKYDDVYSAQRYTPRRAKTNWSELNKYRARKMIADGLMTVAGQAVLPNLDSEDFVIAEDILAALQKDPQTWANFLAFPDHYQKIRIGFVEEVRKNTPIFEQRLANLVKQTSLNKKFGTVQ